MIDHRKLELLKGVDLFSALDDSKLESIADRFQAKTFLKDELILIEEDQANQSLFIIASGSVKVFITGVDGREAILALLNKGEFFGEMSLLDGEPRSASVKAFEETQLLILRRDDFLNELKRIPELALSLLAEISKRLRRANKQISNLSLLSVYGRVAATLLQLKEEQGKRSKLNDGSYCVLIQNKPSQQQLADMSGTTRETVSRVLGYLQKKGSIAIVGKNLYILRESELKVGDT